jgi:hypothetical protein
MWFPFVLVLLVMLMKVVMVQDKIFRLVAKVVHEDLPLTSLPLDVLLIGLLTAIKREKNLEVTHFKILLSLIVVGC